ncbi:hypothetical protein EJB05_26189, partial [Eragrostis curvula]
MGHGEKKSDKCKCAYAVVIAASIAVIGLAVASSVLMATASQCTIYADYNPRPKIVSYSDYRPFVYLVWANAIAAVLAALAVFLSVWKKGKDKVARKAMPFVGAAVAALLYSSTGAAFAAGDGMMTYTAANGKRVSVCDGDVAGGNFCRQVRVAILLSFGAAVMVAVVEVVKGLALSKKKKSSCGGSDSDSDSESDACGHGSDDVTRLYG